MSVLHASHVLWPIPRWKWLSPTMKNRGLGPLGPSILDPIYVIYAFGSMLSCILCERQKFSESHKLKRFGARNQFRAARFVTVLIIGSSLNAMELVVRNKSVGGPGTTKSRDMILDWWLLTSSEMSVLHASHVLWPIPRWKWLSPTMKKSWSGTTRTINFGPHICDLCLWIDVLLHSLWMTKIFRKSQIEALWCPESVQSSAICDHFIYWM